MEFAAAFFSFFVLVFGAIIVLLIGLLVLLSRLFAAGGWGALAEHFRAEEQPEGARLNMQQIMVGPVRYRGCVVASSARGLYLKMFIFPFHPPLLIPWYEFRHVEDTTLYWRRAKRLTIGDPPIAHLTVLNDLYERAIQPNLVGRGA